MNRISGYEPNSWNALEIIDHQVAMDKFNRLNRQARLANFWNRLTGRPETLRSHPSGIGGLDRGVREVPIQSILGSVSRVEDYDRQFRPLNPALKDRWIGIYMLNESSGWEPVVLRKIGAQYFVVDGHHRVSVARHSGWKTIEARVYE